MSEEEKKPKASKKSPSAAALMKIENILKTLSEGEKKAVLAYFQVQQG